MKVVFRVDASIDIGTGHVMRCLTLADELKEQGTETTFITRSHPGNMGDVISKKGFKVLLLPAPVETYQVRKDDVAHASWLGVPWEQDAVETIKALGSSRQDWLIVDHYGIDARWHRKLRNQVSQIMVIDDLADRPLDCDIVMDQTYGRKEEDYKTWVSLGCQMLLGSRYALLRPEFMELRQKAIEKRKKFNGINRILVSMGGVDTNNVTSMVLEGLSCVNWGHNPVIDVVMGRDAPHLQKVVAQAEKSTLEILVSTDISDMAERMLAADLAIGAGGTTSWERCCLGLPTLMISLAGNQALIAHEVEKVGASIHIGSVGDAKVGAIKASLQKLNEDTDLMRDMSGIGFQLVDGLGVSKLAEYMAHRE